MLHCQGKKKQFMKPRCLKCMLVEGSSYAAVAKQLAMLAVLSMGRRSAEVIL